MLFPTKRDNSIIIDIAQAKIIENLRTIVDIIVLEEIQIQEDDDSFFATGTCMEYFLKHNVLQILVNKIDHSRIPGLCTELVHIISTMISLLNYRFLFHNTIHVPTIKLIQLCLSEQQKSDVTYLMYVISTKIHGFPDLLQIFFYRRQNTPQTSDVHPTAGVIGYEFLLLKYILQFIHCGGKPGELARKSVLLILNMANKEEQLKEYITLRSDCVIAVISKLTALYTKLPTKLANITTAPFNQYADVVKDPSLFLLQQYITRYFNEQHHVSNTGQLNLFLKMLQFCQDVCEHCPYLRKSLLLYLRIAFLENALYSSMLQVCSSFDSEDSREKSNVVIINYIDIILQSIQQKDLVETVMEFLLDEIIDTFDSIILSEDSQQQLHFPLKDLIFISLRSKSQDIILVTLKLLKTFMTQHCDYINQFLLIVAPHQQHCENKNTTASIHVLDHLQLYFGLIFSMERTRVRETFEIGYNNYLHDIEQRINKYKSCCVPKKSRELCMQQLNGNDSLFGLLTKLLWSFFDNLPEVNLMLTEVTSTLAMCQCHHSLEGWILQAENMNGSCPSFHTIFQALVMQVDYYRDKIERFDTLLDERWNELVFDELCEASDLFSKEYETQQNALLSSGITNKPTSTVTTSKVAATMTGSFILTEDTISSTSASTRSSSTAMSYQTPPLLSTSHDQKTKSVHVETLFTAHPYFITSTVSETALSSLLNNVIILEEAIKEIAAIIQVLCSE